MSSSDPLNSELIRSVEAWIAGDISGADQSELRGLLAAIQGDAALHQTAIAELRDRFAGDLRFGTAGLRGPLAAGPNRMNRAVVVRTTWALSEHLRMEFAELGMEAPARVVIGHDHRHGSAQFAQDAAGVLQAAGHQVLFIAEQVPTPVLAFALRTLNADAGIMITASHNPAQDNGYKLYLGGHVTDDSARGVQIVSPVDTKIAQLISQAPPAAEIARAAEGWALLTSRLLDKYHEQILPLVPQDPLARARRADLRILYTPVHGVGGKAAVGLLRSSGFAQVSLVAAQFTPDPDFSTVTFPNPEESGTLNLAFAQAVANGADVVLANDPDADRLAMGIHDVDGRWRALHGSELGALLALHQLRTGALRAGDQVASSVVSGTLLPKIAAAHGLHHTTTLTGFKWLARVPALKYGFEEAIGYCLAPELVRDKDGLSAALIAAEMCSSYQHRSLPGTAEEERGRGGVVVPELVNLAKVYGLHVNSTFSLGLRSENQSQRVLSELVSTPPVVLGEVLQTVDLAVGSAELPPTSGVVVELASGTRLLARPSGTEPKLKIYLESAASLEATATAAQYLAGRQELLRQHQELEQHLRQWGGVLLGETR